MTVARERVRNAVDKLDELLPPPSTWLVLAAGAWWFRRYTLPIVNQWARDDDAINRHRTELDHQHFAMVRDAVDAMREETGRSQRLALRVGVATALLGALLGAFAGAWAARLVG